MNEINKNMKLDNFRYRLGKLQYTLDKNFYLDDISAESVLGKDKFYQNIFTPQWVFESKNEFVRIIIEELNPDKYLRGGIQLALKESRIYEKSDNLIDYITGKSSIQLSPKALGELPVVMDMSDWGKTSLKEDTKAVDFHKYKLIFWWLIIVALDCALYEKYVDYIVDAADIFGFSEVMIDDWCTAVIYWLNGNDINPECNLDLKTDEAKEFFLNEWIY